MDALSFAGCTPTTLVGRPLCTVGSHTSQHDSQSPSTVSPLKLTPRHTGLKNRRVTLNQELCSARSEPNLSGRSVCSSSFGLHQTQLSDNVITRWFITRWSPSRPPDGLSSRRCDAHPAASRIFGFGNFKNEEKSIKNGEDCES